MIPPEVRAIADAAAAQAGQAGAVERVAAVLAAHEHDYEPRISPSHACSCGEWAGDFDWDGSENDGYNDTADAYRTHVAEALAAAGLIAKPVDLSEGAPTFGAKVTRFEARTSQPAAPPP